MALIAGATTGNGIFGKFMLIANELVFLHTGNAYQLLPQQRSHVGYVERLLEARWGSATTMSPCLSFARISCRLAINDVGRSIGAHPIARPWPRIVHLHAFGAEYAALTVIVGLN